MSVTPVAPPFLLDDEEKDQNIYHENKELYNLLARVKAAYLDLGGDSGPKLDPATKTFDGVKARLISKLFSIETNVKRRNKLKAQGEAELSGEERRDLIRLKLRIQSEMDDIAGLKKQLVEALEKDVKSKKCGEEEFAARVSAINILNEEIYDVYFHMHGRRAMEDPKNPDNLRGSSAVATGTGALEGGKPTPGAAHEIGESPIFEDLKAKTGAFKEQSAYEEMTGEHLQTMAMIDQQVNVVQGAILDDIMKSLDSLKNKAEAMGDEIQLQEKMIDDVSKKTDKTNEKVTKIGDRAAAAVKTMNENSGNMCCYAICFFLLLGVAFIIYKMLTKK